MPQETPAPLRRNGRIPSCEPCRKSKLACDHSRPICRRCLARGKGSLCTYHPAPMTGQGKKARLARALADSPRHDYESEQATIVAESPSSPRARSSDSPNASTSKTPFTRPTRGFLGAMSYLGPLSESQGGITGADELRVDPADALPHLSHDKGQLDDGVRVLRALGPLVKNHQLDDPSQGGSCGENLPPPIIAPVFANIKAMFKDCMTTHPDERKLRALAARICDNTAKHLGPPGRIPMADYHLQFTGSNLRWESFAMVFSRLSLRASPLGNHAALTAQKSHHSHWKNLIETSNVCLALCDDFGSLNDVTFWVMLENYVSLTLFHGDAGYVPWKRLGDLSSALFALGLHQDITVTPDVPRWMAELRKSSVAHAYTCDKTISCFVGRPPRINGRYCALQPPLPLTLDQLSLHPDELDAMLERMGDDVHKVKRIRDFGVDLVFVLPLMIEREKILELFLCRPYSQPDPEARIAELMINSEREWERRPAEFKYRPDVWDTGWHTPNECLSVFLLMLEHEYNDFLIQRYRVQRLHADSHDLLRISSCLLWNALTIIPLRDKLGGGSCDIPWMLAIYCLPPAGVLALELLRASQRRTPPSKAFSKSDVIQNLSVLAGALDWVATPGVGNFTLCRQARDMLKRIIDRILDPVDSSVAQASGSEADLLLGEQAYSAEELSWFGATNPGDELWNSLEEHPLLMFNMESSNWN